MLLRKKFQSKTIDEIPDLYLPPAEVPFDPGAWRHYAILETTGSYAYALNLPEAGEAKPGYLFMKSIMDDATKYYGAPLPETRDNLSLRMHHDGLTFLGNTLPETGHVLAFMAKPSENGNPSELLCIRRDSNKNWSYRLITEKYGCGNPHIPRQHDFSSNLITCLEKADFGPFTNFLGYASVPYEGIFYYRRTAPPAETMTPFNECTPAAIELGWHLKNI